MIIMLQTEDIVREWPLIKYAILKAHPERASRIQLFLEHLLAGASQCWFILDEDRILKTVVITKIYHDILEERPCLFITLAYGYDPSTTEDKYELDECLTRFAINRGCDPHQPYRIVTANKMAANAGEAMGLKLTHWVLTKEVA